MDVRRLMTGLCVFALGTTVAVSGDPYRGHYGGACDGDCEGCPEGEAESQGGGNGDGGKDNSDPIYLATGDFQHVQTDLFIPGRGLDFEIKRFYRSKSGIYGRKSTQPNNIAFEWELNMVSEPLTYPPVGMNWTLNYDMRVWMGGADENDTLVPQPDPSTNLPSDTRRGTNITLFFGNGRIEQFKLDPTWSPSVDGNGVLAEPVEYHHETYDKVIEFEHTGKPIYLRDSEDTVYQFNPMYTIDYDTYNNDEYYQYAGRLASITDRNGNKISFIYETSAVGDERIATAIDTLGHEIEFRYHDDPNSPITSSDLGDQIWQIEDHAGRIVEYGYDTSEPLDSRVKLTSVKLPAITSNNEFPLVYVDGGSVIDHGRFPQGRTWTYEYTGLAQGGMWGDGLLSKITDPNGNVILENSYEYDLDNIRASGRVIRQEYGGDTYNYTVTNDSGSTEFASGYYAQWAEDFYVWVNDRRGAITRFKYRGNILSNGENHPSHLQLLEKTEFDGFVDDADARVWAECTNGVPTTWYTYDTNGTKVALTGSLPGAGRTWSWTTNDRWSTESIYAPTDGSSNADYTEIVYDDNSSNPLHWKRRLMKSQHSASTNETITEYWHYGSGVGGCGCSGSNFATGYQDGNGNITYREFDSNGNVTKIYHDVPAITAAGAGLTVSSDPTDSMSPIPGLAVGIEEFTYNQWGQIETHTHPGKVTLDSQGAEVTHARVDKYVYYTDQNDEANYGRLKQKIVDFGGENLTTEYEYNLVGNVIKVTDPGGDITDYLFNQARQLVRERHYASNGTDLYAQEDFYYDANGNLTIEELRNLDGDQNVNANKKLTTVHGYDVLNYRTVTSRERDIFSGTISEETDGSRRAKVPVSGPSTDPNYNTAFVTQRWEFDENRNLKKVLYGEAVKDGGQPENVVTYEYDSRDLLVKRTTGDGDTKELVVTASYDEKGRAEQVTIDPSGNTQSQHYEVLYDGFDRVTRVTDPMGNERHLVYDDNNNVVEAYLCGPLDEDTSGGTDSGDTLARVFNVYDSRDRRTSQSIDVFGYDYATGTGETCGQIPGTATQQVTEYVYNPDSSLHSMLEDSGVNGVQNITDYYYDTASRLEVVVDGDGNDSFTEYDSHSNITKVTYTDFSTMSGVPFEIFDITYTYDALHRRVSSTDSAGNSTSTKYDSRGNAVEMTDARGNITTNIYDNLSRLTSTSVTMTSTGDGTGTANGTILTARSYDDSNRLISETDDNGEATSYEYDALNRVVKIIMPDSEEYLTSYDHNGNAAVFTDPRGVIVTQLFDLNNRLTSRTISGTTVAGTTSESFKYDGLGRLREATNNFTKITREYDSRSSVVRDIQNIDYTANPPFPNGSDQVVWYGYDEANNNSQILYPSGRLINRTYDELNRLTSIVDNQMINPITDFDYVGRRLQRRTNGNNTQTDYDYNGYQGYSVSGDDGYSRVASISTTNSTTSVVLDAFDFTWDKAQNRTSYGDTGSGMVNRRHRSFSYDSSNRLVSTDVDFPDPFTDYTSPVNNGVTDYTLDGVHNRISVAGFDENGAEVGDYSVNENNQYTDSPMGGGADWVYLYDENGNMILKAQDSFADFNDDYSFNQLDVSAFLAAYGNEDPEADINGDGSFNFLDVSAFMDEYGANQGIDLEHHHYTYDYRNQLIEVSLEAGMDVNSVITNTYDPLARRVVETIDLDGDQGIDAQKQMVYGGASLWEVIEQIDLLNNDEVLSTHVFGLDIDDEIHYQRPNATTIQDIWSHRDDLNSLTSITDDSGAVLERYEYGDYGQLRVLNASGVVQSGSQFDAAHVYTGRIVLPGTELYDYRNRVMDSELGRFIQRDPLWYIDGMNLYTYASSNSAALVDPFGLSSGGKKDLPPKGKCDDLDEDIKKEEGKRGTGYYNITYYCNGNKRNVKGHVTDMSTINDTLKDIKDKGCCVSRLSMSTHHNPTDGSYINGSDHVSDSELSGNVKLCGPGEGGSGVEVILNSCNSRSLACKILDSNKESLIDIDITWTEGWNLNIPGWNMDVPGYFARKEGWEPGNRKNNRKDGDPRSDRPDDIP